MILIIVVKIEGKCTNSNVACEMCNSTDWEMRSCTPLQRCVLLYDDNWILDVEEDVKEDKDIFCDYCGKKINKNDLLLQHEYGSYYCSYEHLVKGAFVGHYKEVNTKDMNE